VEGWPSNAQFEYLADSVWQHFSYGKNAIHQNGHHGNAILSRFPIIAHENIDISTSKLERRGLLHAVAQDPESGQQFDLMCIHLDLREFGRQRQLRSICERIDAANDHATPLLICGDFNDWRQKASRVLTEVTGVKEAFTTFQGRHVATFPSFLPVLALDRIYFRGLTVNEARVLRGTPWHKLSDHLPVFADFSV
jgi:endonuclease/exonuclease/phosphatase family metal-dependent hydrolase